MSRKKRNVMTFGETFGKLRGKRLGTTSGGTVAPGDEREEGPGIWTLRRNPFKKRSHKKRMTG